jgi:subtilisin family serine protease
MNGLMGRVALAAAVGVMGLAQAMQPAKVIANSTNNVTPAHINTHIIAHTPQLQPQVPSPPTSTLSPELQRTLSTAKADDRLHILIHLKSTLRKTEKSVDVQASLLRPYLALDRANAVSQRANLVNALQVEAQSSQASLQQFLAAPELQAQVDSVRSLWVVNAFALRATPDVIAALAQRDDIETIVTDSRITLTQQPDPPLLPNPQLPITQYLDYLSARTPYSLSLQNPQAGPVAPPAPGTVDWGIRKLRADIVHNALGVTGQGVVIGSVDTGVDWTHPALRTQYRGYGNGVAVDHLHNWFDPTDEGAQYPEDSYSHGTHTVGTMVGPNGIGVAPGAKWMACKSLAASGGLDSWALACWQWMMAPNGDPSYAPDVINNSWGATDGTSPVNPIYKLALQSLKAAGIFVVFSAGNNGPRAGTVGSPASIPEAIAIGATDSDDEVAYFSSRGPSPYDNALKPILSAPGVRVISTVPGGVYKTASGTSMAAPHTSGAAALLLSANPSLDTDGLLNVLTRTAVPLSGTVPNNDSGYGRIDAYAAVLSVIQTGVLTGTVREKSGGAPIANARVIAFAVSSGNNTNTPVRAEGYTDANGSYAIPVPFGVYTASASAFGFGSASLGPRLVVTNSVVSLPFSLMELPSGAVRGRVRDAVSGDVVTATVTALGTPKSSLAVNSCPPCRYALDLPTGPYVIEARAVGYFVQTQTVLAVANNLVDLDFEMQPTQRIAVIDSGAWYQGSQSSYYHEALDSLRLAYDTYRIKNTLRDTPNITQLLKYNTVIWSAPFDSPGLVGASETLSKYLTAGNNLLLSGQDIGFYDGGGIGYSSYTEKLNVVFRSDNSQSDVVYGKPNSLLAGKVLSIAGGDGPYLTAGADVVAVANQDKGGLIGSFAPEENYDGAGVFASLCFKHKSAFYGFGLEGINSFADRVDVISRTLTAFDAPRATVGVELVSQDSSFTYGLGPASVIGQPGAVITHVLRVRNIGEAGLADTYNLQLSGNVWQTRLAATSVSLKPCATANITVTVNIPPGAPMNSSDAVTVTATSQRMSNITDTLAFTTKTPGSILLVDDERFYNTEQKYVDALAAGGNVRVDRWENQGSFGFASQTPPLNFLRQYSMVVWFNGYDWYDPITLKEQDTLQKYLDAGGRLFFSSQAALQYTVVNGFDKTYWGVGLVDFGDAITTVVGEAGNPLGEGLPLSSMAPFPYTLNLSTAVQPLPNTLVVLRNQNGQPAALAKQGINYTGFRPTQWRTTFLPFAFEALTPTMRAEVMNRAVGWLSWLGDSALSPAQTLVNGGERLVYTLTVRADPFASTAPSQTVAFSVPLGGGLTVVSSTLPNALADNAGAWRGFMRPGEVLTWTFEAQIADGLADQTPLVATLDVSLPDVGIHWTRDSVVRAAAPALQASFTLPQKPKWKTDSVMTLRLKNIGSSPAPSLTLSLPVPTGLVLSEDAPVDIVEITAVGRSPSSATAMQRVGNLIVIQRDLAVGQEIEVMFPVSIPRFGETPLAFYCTARIETDKGMTMQTAQWLWPDTRQYVMPLMFKP